MSDTQEVAGVGFLVAAFTVEDGAEQALNALKQAKKDKQIYFDDAAVIRQDAEGGVHYFETGDMTTGKGAGVGALIGGVIGILGGPMGIVVGAGAGALIGGGAAHGDAGFDNKSLEKIGVALKPGTSALLATTEKYFVEALRKEATEEEQREVVTNLSEGISNMLEAGRNAVMSLVITEEGIAVQEVDADDETLHALGFVATADGMVVAEAIATPEGAAYQVGVATEDGVVTETAVATEDGVAVLDTVTTEEGTVGVLETAVVDEEAGEGEVDAETETSDDDSDSATVAESTA